MPDEPEYPPAEDYYIPEAELFEDPVWDVTYEEPPAPEGWTEPTYGGYYAIVEDDYKLPFSEEEMVWSNAYLEPGFD